MPKENTWAVKSFFRKFNILRQEPTSPVAARQISVIPNNFHLARFELASTKIGRDEQESTEFIKCFWPCLIVFRSLGLFPIKKTGNHLVRPRGICSIYWVPTFLLIGFQIVAFSNYVLNLTTGNAEDTGSSIEIIQCLIEYSQFFFNSGFAVLKIKLLPKLLHIFKNVEAAGKAFKTDNSRSLVRDCFIIFTAIELAHLVSLVLYYVSTASQRKVGSVGEYFESLNNDYIKTHHGSCYTGALIALSEIYCHLGWNVGDVLLILLAMIVTRYFIRINDELALNGAKLSLAARERFRRGHLQACHLIEACNEIFSSLFFVTYVSNLGFLFSRLYLMLQEDLNDSQSIVQFESIYATCYELFVRIILVSYMAAELNEQAHAAAKIIHTWQIPEYEPAAENTLISAQEFMTNFSRPMGFSGYGFFLLTKAFVGALAGVLVTYEVIILQFQTARSPKQNEATQPPP